MKQSTLRDRVTLEGIGVHSGAPARMVLHPAEPGSGVCFLRTGLEDARERLIEARASAVRATELCTVIAEPSGASVSTVEHLLAALSGLCVDNVLIEIDGPEVPILDGSSGLIVEAIDQAGLRLQGMTRRVIRVCKPVRIEMGRAWAELRPARSGFSLDVEIDFPTPLIGRQRFETLLTPEVFRKELARARTFGLMKDVERLWKANFALGASLENTIAIGDDRIINPEGLRWPDEFVRHKTLDAIGDLALAGAPIQGCYRSYCGGHKLNAMVVEALLKDRTAFEYVDVIARRAVSGQAGAHSMQMAYAADAG